jgi:transcriptional regulator with XRE-family HTH domain
MKKAKRARLEAAGWKVGAVQELLGLSDEEMEFIELKLALARSLRSRRERKGLTQTQLAKLIESSQSRVAKMEAGDRSVSLDLLVRSLLAIGTTKRELARIISAPRRAAQRSASAAARSAVRCMPLLAGHAFASALESEFLPGQLNIRFGVPTCKRILEVRLPVGLQRRIGTEQQRVGLTKQCEPWLSHFTYVSFQIMDATIEHVE